MTMVTYLERLAWAMTQANVTALELSKVLGVSKLAVRKILDGRSGAFTAYNNAVAARFLQVNSDWLATGEGDPRPSPDDAALDLARRFEALGAVDQERLVQRLAELEALDE